MIDVIIVIGHFQASLILQRTMIEGRDGWCRDMNTTVNAYGNETKDDIENVEDTDTK